MDLARIGLLGGSFDPIHKAHLELALAAREQLQLDEVQLIPAAQPWQRPALGASAQDRLNMTSLAVRPYPALSVNPEEIRRGGPTYTIDTLRALPAGARYYWILGSDQLLNFCSWHCWQDIVAQVELAVAQRPGAQLQTPEPLAALLKQHGRDLHLIDFPPQDISATDIRERVQRGDNIDGLLPPQVADYIRKNRLYLSH
ncbi:MAG TPA: nicotinate (nicotinamide) nucleotide adenylyltransferase [Alcaligenes sp.]|nr:nicotinate (nicotinamide) nucleotide adenylyltransferase [Alcaligenes sp.]HRL28112.1 nicotinate (nicotinamide) nucleotide adenylyltransferase [Alcaligenes sp.]